MKITPFVDVTFVRKNKDKSVVANEVLASIYVRDADIELIANSGLMLTKAEALKIAEALKEAAECLPEEIKTQDEEKGHQEDTATPKDLYQTTTSSE